MRKSYSQIIEEYKKSMYGSYDDHTDSKTNTEKMIRYNEKYWCSEDLNKLIEHTVFGDQKKLGSLYSIDDFRHNKSFKVTIQIGGMTFLENEFDEFKRNLRSKGNNYIYVLENPMAVLLGVDNIPINKPEFQLKFRFPVSISWEDINSGGHFSNVVFGNFPKEFFVFGDKFNLIKYSSNVILSKDILLET